MLLLAGAPVGKRGQVDGVLAAQQIGGADRAIFDTDGCRFVVLHGVVIDLCGDIVFVVCLISVDPVVFHTSLDICLMVLSFRILAGSVDVGHDLVVVHLLLFAGPDDGSGSPSGLAITPAVAAVLGSDICTSGNANCGGIKPCGILVRNFSRVVLAVGLLSLGLRLLPEGGESGESQSNRHHVANHIVSPLNCFEILDFWDFASLPPQEIFKNFLWWKRKINLATCMSRIWNLFVSDHY